MLSVLSVLTTFCGFLPGAALLVEQDGSDQDGHLHHNDSEGLQRLIVRDDLEASGRERGRRRQCVSNIPSRALTKVRFRKKKKMKKTVIKK